MKHHFGDFLDRAGDYWKMTPNKDRYQLMLDNFPVLDSSIESITISKKHTNWREILGLKNLEELTIHEGTKEQFEAIKELKHLKRLRITHLRPKEITPISELVNLEELVLEYVSGFSDLLPLSKLENLHSLHLENLRSVRDFSPLTKISNLKYLYIDGTIDWKQPVDNFTFLNEMQKLEVFSLGQVMCKADYPIFLGLIKLNNLKKVKIFNYMFPTEEYAFLQEAIPSIEGTQWEPISIFPNRYKSIEKDDQKMKLSKEDFITRYPNSRVYPDGRREISDPNYEEFSFLGKKAGSIKCNSKNAEKKCEEFTMKYEAMKVKARNFLTKENEPLNNQN